MSPFFIAMLFPLMMVFIGLFCGYAGEVRAILLALPVVGAAIFLYALEYKFILPFLALAWLLTAGGAGRVKVWEMFDYREGKMSVGDKIWTALAIVLSAVSLWVIISAGLFTSEDWPPSSFRDAVGMAFFPALLVMLWYTLLKGAAYTFISPLFPLERREHAARLQDYFILAPMRRTRYYCIKFEGDAAYWDVSRRQFRGYVENFGSVYRYTAVTGVFGRQFMYKKPVITERISDAAVNENKLRFKFPPDKLDYAMLRWGAFLWLGIMLVIAALFGDFVLLIGWQKMPEMRVTIAISLLVAEIAFITGVWLTVLSVRRMRAISRALREDNRPPLPVKRRLPARSTK